MLPLHVDCGLQPDFNSNVTYHRNSLGVKGASNLPRSRSVGDLLIPANRAFVDDMYETQSDGASALDDFDDVIQDYYDDEENVDGVVSLPRVKVTVTVTGELCDDPQHNSRHVHPVHSPSDSALDCQHCDYSDG
nr:hypothetical protein BaRGS_022203 [Batillaria attramentaria]